MNNHGGKYMVMPINVEIELYIFKCFRVCKLAYVNSGVIKRCLWSTVYEPLLIRTQLLQASWALNKHSWFLL